MEIILSDHKLKDSPKVFTDACKHLAKFLNADHRGLELFIHEVFPASVRVCAWNLGKNQVEMKYFTSGDLETINKELKGCKVIIDPSFTSGVTIIPVEEKEVKTTLG